MCLDEKSTVLNIVLVVLLLVHLSARTGSNLLSIVIPFLKDELFRMKNASIVKVTHTASALTFTKIPSKHVNFVQKTWK